MSYVTPRDACATCHRDPCSCGQRECPVCLGWGRKNDRDKKGSCRRCKGKGYLEGPAA